MPGAILGGCIALMGVWLSWAPFDFDVEERFGLMGLFHLRGERKPPEDVVIVGIDAFSSKQAGWSPKPEFWPRSVHAELIKKLSEACAKVIVYDIFFAQARDPNEDLSLAEAIREAGNVALVSHLAIAEESLPPGFSAQSLQLQQQPLALFAAAAAGVAPFPIPNASSGLSGYWLFKSDAGDVPSLPALALQMYASGNKAVAVRSPPNVSDSVRGAVPKILIDVMRWRRQSFADSSKSRENSAPTRREVMTEPLLQRMYRAEGFQYLNFYGPPRTIRTIDYPSALKLKGQSVACGKSGVFSGKVVLVGMSETSPVEQKDRDTFDTVFTQRDGRKLSGVEIAATAIANFLEDKPIHRLSISTNLAIVVGCGWALGMIWCCLSAPSALALSVSLIACYFWFVRSCFAEESLWLPWVVPAGQWAVAGIAGIAMQRRDLQKRINTLRTSLAEWLPAGVVTEILSDPVIARRARGLVYGTGMSIHVTGDLTTFTKHDPLLSSRRMADCFRSIAKAVTTRSGFVSEQTRHSQISLWVAAKPNIVLRRQACESALDVVRAFDDFLLRSGEHRLAVRIGMHTGTIAVDAASTENAMGSRGFGGVIDMAESIAQLNAVLGTRVLVSEEVSSGIASLQLRQLGSFVLSGMIHPVEIAELLGFDKNQEDAKGWLCSAFFDALEAYRQGDWDGCVQELLTILERFPEDGPSLFYLKRCEFFRRHSPVGTWDHRIRL